MARAAPPPPSPTSPNLQESIMEIIAVGYAPMQRDTLRNALQQMQTHAKSDTPYSVKDIQTATNTLIDHGYLSVQSANTLETAEPRYQQRFTDTAYAGQRLSTIAQILRDLNHARSHPRHQVIPQYQNYDHFVAEFRLAIMVNDTPHIQRLLSQYRQWHTAKQHPFIAMDTRGFAAPWTAHIHSDTRFVMANTLAAYALSALDGMPELWPVLRETEWPGPQAQQLCMRHVVEHALLCGDTTQARQDIHAGLDPKAPETRALLAWAHLIDGDLEAAWQDYAFALTRANSKGKRHVPIPHYPGLFALFPLVWAKDWSTLEHQVFSAHIRQQDGLQDVISAWRHLLRHRQHYEPQQQVLELKALIKHYDPSLDHLPLWIVLSWIDKQALQEFRHDIEQLQRLAQAQHYRWVAQQMQGLLDVLASEEPLKRSPHHLATWHAPKPEWQLLLKALADIAAPPAEDPAEAAPQVQSERLVWWLKITREQQLHIEPRLQVITRSGQWSQGRSVPLKDLFRSHRSFMDEADRTVCAGLRQLPNYSVQYQPNALEFTPRESWPALVGHPRLFRGDHPKKPLELVDMTPELHIKRSKTGLELHIDPQPPTTRRGDAWTPIWVVEENPARWLLVRMDEAQSRLYQLLNRGQGISLPSAAENPLQEVLGSLAKVITIHSDTDLSANPDADLIEHQGDPHPCLALTPLNRGLSAELRVRPMGPRQNAYPPGHGGAQFVTLDPEGQPCRVIRDLETERQQADALVTACTTLHPWEVQPYYWHIEETEACLEVLEQLAQRSDQVTLEWPEGESLRLRGPTLSGLALSLRLRQNNEWFEASGQVQVDENLVLDLQKLLGLVAQHDSRFLPLGNGQFITLTTAFRKRLEDMNNLADSAARKPRYHALSAPLLEEIIGEVGEFKVPKRWLDYRDRLRSAENQPAELPKTFTAELRPYQLEGYQWLMRLAAWGVGACLADDMGLGKTIQVLAVLVARATQGPSLVIAPTSVAHNWRAEMQRFAPTLNPVLLGQQERAAQIEALKPFDVLITSYGLMVQEIEALSARKDWNCLVLDEAQAIKNPTTLRARAACQLSADFRVITTGTPIENHLGELWSLFRFLNPWLLGSLQAFNHRFAKPIELEQSPAVRDRLRRLLRPFILRRLKSAVLDELPPRTEIRLEVTPSKEEIAFYEALRRHALEQLDHAETIREEKARFQILAAITRLRRAACNPRLIDPKLRIPSSKQALFMEVLNELREGGHRALVFSQFVDHLSLIRQALDAQQISYQYLDGATPMNARSQRVQAFQAGEGEVFLISLKAGGTGLNLTAADYVIHLDPWWNPAVEDQASDRAHRMGQQRPVTVYRLVVNNSIEERILELHAQKRDLADSLLEGGESSARLDAEALMNLLREASLDEDRA